MSSNKKNPKQTRYSYKDQIYGFIMTGKMKIGAVWVVCCIYKSYKDGRVYIRERGDFHEKFKPVVDQPIQESDAILCSDCGKLLRFFNQ